MNSLTRHIITAAVVFTAFNICNAQSLQEYYKTIHTSTEDCISYDGLLDEVFPLEMLICGDKGVYKMKSSSDMYSLSIEVDSDTIEMVEEDSQGRSSGYITLTKSDNGFSGEWNQIESAAKYSFTINQDVHEDELTPYYITRLSGIIRSRIVNINIDHTNGTLEIQEKYGLQGRYKSEYICKDKKCNNVILKPEGIIGVSSVEIYKDKSSDYKMIVLTADQNREITELQILTQIKKKTKAYSDYRSMLLAEYAKFNDKNLDTYLKKKQAHWIKSTSINLRKFYKADSTEIVSDRLKYQASSWIDIELWTEDFISGIQYKQYNWQPEVEVSAFAYNIDKSKAVTLTDVWDKDWNLTNLDSTIDNENSTWVVGHDGIYKIYFDRVKGIQREPYLYSDLAQYIDRGSWLDNLVDQDKIKG
ncbi:hypothetical protein N9Q30_00075 [bacterium]|nr:hypothetical protein [bacterium]